MGNNADKSHILALSIWNKLAQDVLELVRRAPQAACRL